MPRKADDKIVVACLTGVTGNPIVEQTIYFSDKGFVTNAASAPAHLWMPPRLRDAGGFSRRAFAKGVSGRAEISYGRLVLENADGELNFLTDLAFDGRPVRVFSGRRGDAFPDAFSELLVAQVSAVRLSRGQAIEFTLGAATEVLEKTPSEVRFAGDNVLPDGVEGTEDDLKDLLKPLVFGVVKNAQPAFVNTVRNIYQVSQTQAVIDAVYSAGVALTRKNVRSSLAELQGVTDAGESEYDVYEGIDGTYFRLGFSAVDLITFDATATGSTTLGPVFVDLANLAGMSLSQIEIDELNTLPAVTVGLWLGRKEQKLARLFDVLAASAGAAWWIDRLGAVRVAKLEAPGTPRWHVTETEALTASASLEGPTGGGVPAKGIDIAYAPLEKTQEDSDLVAAVSAEDRVRLKEEFRHLVHENPAIAQRHLAAENLEVETRLHEEADAQGLATELLALHGALGLRAAIEVALDSGLPADLEIGDTISVTLPRLSLANRAMLVVGIDHRPVKNRMKLDLWDKGQI